jgi:trk system potassium uptake protein
MNHNKITGYALILNYLGMFAILIGFIILFPMISVIFFKVEFRHLLNFLIPGLISIAIGLLIVFIFRKKEKSKLEKYHDAILVVALWIMAILLSALPFYLSKDYTFAQAVFETSSGYSTTGLTVTNVASAPKIFLLYRSILQFVGGAGLVLVLTAAISDKFGMRLYSAEGHSDKLVPNLIRSGRAFLGIYLLLVVIGFILYVIFGMSVFDAINHAMCAVATGGFSTQVESIGHYQSIPIEVITIFLMIAGGTNFVVHFLILTGKYKSAMKHVEVKSFFIIALIGILFSLIYLIPFYNNFGSAIRNSIFHLVSALTGTGYQITPSFTVFPQVFFGLIILFMIFGAGMGSTTGGLKQYRVALMFKSLHWHFQDQLSHKNLIKKRYVNRLGAKTKIEKEDILASNMYVTLYIFVLFLGTIFFASFGDNSLPNALFEYASTLGTVGLSVGITGPDAHPAILWFSSISMFLGRLEFFVIFIGISKFFRDMTHKRKKPINEF